MKKIVYLTGVLSSVFIISCSKPDPKIILRKSFEKCQSIANGYYEMTRHMKYMSDTDTLTSFYSCYFKKLPEDTIFSSAFHYQQFDQGEYSRNVLYTGNDFVYYSTNDSAGVIMSKTRWAKDIQAYSHNYKFYLPFTNKKSYPLPEDSAFIDNKHEFEFIGEEYINNIACFHVKMNIIQTHDSTEMMQTIRAENNYWISKQDYLPIQYTIAYDLVMNGDTMYQFEKNELSKHELDTRNQEEHLELASIPSNIKLNDYVPYKRPELLTKDTVAPDWSLSSLDDKIVKLSDFKGKIVLVDFFYKSCYPCMQALPALQNLHEKYKNKGFVLIGINPYDTKEEDEIDVFLAKRGVTYTVLLGGQEVAKNYHVSGYPTMYLIDKAGKVVYSQVGYGEGTDDELEQIIKQFIN